MRLNPSDVLERARSSLWLLPLLTLLVALVGATVMVYIDERTEFAWLNAIITRDPNSARAVLSVVATSMLSFTALVFTITMVVLQLASAQYSPRITRTFLRDRETKWTLSLFLATFTFAALVLRSVTSSGESVVPSLSIGLTYLLVFASLLAFVGYLHHMAGSVRISSIMRRIAREAEEVLKRTEERDVKPGADTDWEWRPVIAVVLHRGTAGVLTHVDEQALCRAAVERDAVVRLLFAVGDFVPNGAPLLEVRGALSGHDNAELCELVTVAEDRTPQQDLAMPLRHLVDVALRALSPGINDPTTAVQAIDYVHDLMRRVLTGRLQTPYVFDADNAVRVVIPRMTWEGFVRLAFTEIRLAGSSQVQVCRRLLSVLDDLLSVAPEARRPPLLRERERLVASMKVCFSNVDDRDTAGQGDAQGLGVYFPPIGSQ